MNDSRLLLQEFHTLLSYLEDGAERGASSVYALPITEMYRKSLMRRIEAELKDERLGYVPGGDATLLRELAECAPVMRWKEFQDRGEERIPCFLSVELAKKIAAYYDVSGISERP